jgi:uncharacterized membrane protein
MDVVTLVHIAGGSAALVAGGVALAVTKGGSMHVRAGAVFVASMVVMTLTGTLIALFLPERGTAVIGVLTCYLVVSSWWAARSRDGTAGRAVRIGFVVASACAALQMAFGLQAASSPLGRFDSLPTAPHFVFAALAALAAAHDLRFIRRGRLASPERVARHLWRMCAALAVATSSFFLGQQDEFPAALRGPYLILPTLVTLGVMALWLVRLRRTGKRHHAVAA